MPAIQTCFLTPQITENIKKWLKMVSNGGPKIHQKPVQHGNGKRDMRNQAQQQCIPSYSWACQTLPNDSKWVFTIPRLGWSFSWGTQNCNWVLLTAPKASTCSPALSCVFLRVRKHLHGFLSIPKCAQAFSNIPETSLKFTSDIHKYSYTSLAFPKHSHVFPMIPKYLLAFLSTHNYS